MPNDFLSQEEIDILLGKKDGAKPFAMGAPAAGNSPAIGEPPAVADPSAPSGTPVAADAPAAAGLPATGAQPGHFIPAPREEEAAPPNLGAILEFSLQVSIRLGKASKTLQEIRKLSSGAVVELDCYVHETLDIYIGGKLIARGEVVLIEENFGVKIREIMDPMERVKKLR